LAQQILGLRMTRNTPRPKRAQGQDFVSLQSPELRQAASKIHSVLLFLETMNLIFHLK